MIKRKILVAFGTRPEAIKMVPVIKELKSKGSEFVVKVCVTAQHRQMLDSVLEVFKVKPDYDLNIMQEGQTLFHITAEALKRSEKVLLKEKPDLILVHGDTTTTFALTLAAFYQKIPVGHVEAGLRSYNKRHPYPEEINRRLTDSICDLHFAPTLTAKNALLMENIPAKGIFVTGNTVIDALHMVLVQNKKYAEPRLKKLFSGTNTLAEGSFILVTAHRRENHGKPFENIFRALRRIAREYPKLHIIYPVHLSPSVQKPARKILAGIKNVYLLPPVDYADLAKLIESSFIVVTDSGGLQEEAPSLGKPVLVLRKVTERPEAVKAGTVKVIGTDEQKVYKEIRLLLDNKKAYNKMAKSVNPYGDGKAAFRTVEAIRYYFKSRSATPPEFV